MCVCVCAWKTDACSLARSRWKWFAWQIKPTNESSGQQKKEERENKKKEDQAVISELFQNFSGSRSLSWVETETKEKRKGEGKRQRQKQDCK